jgi:hypothetical protein
MELKRVKDGIEYLDGYPIEELGDDGLAILLAEGVIGP